MRLGRGYGFDPEAGEYPVNHGQLVWELARLVSPLLDGARFHDFSGAARRAAGHGRRSTPESLVRQLEKGRRRVRIAFVV